MDHTLRNWHGYYEPPHRGHSGLNLSSPTERDTKPLFNNQHGVARNHHQVMVNNNNNNNGAVYHPHRLDMGIAEAQMSHIGSTPMDFWLNQTQNQKYNTDVKVNMNVNHLSHLNSYGGLSEASGSHGLQILQQPEALKEERMVRMDEPLVNGNGPVKKGPGGRPQKSPKPKKPKRAVPKDEMAFPRRKSMGVNINGVDLDLSQIPIPVCSCTGAPQQCYRWGCGGWQSAF